MRVPADGYDHTDERVAEYAACLLEVGGPEMIKWDGVCSDLPVVNVGYLRKCRQWFIAQYGHRDALKDFPHWFIGYKRWILETGSADQGDVMDDETQYLACLLAIGPPPGRSNEDKEAYDYYVSCWV